MLLQKLGGGVMLIGLCVAEKHKLINRGYKAAFGSEEAPACGLFF